MLIHHSLSYRLIFWVYMYTWLLLFVGMPSVDVFALDFGMTEVTN